MHTAKNDHEASRLPRPGSYRLALALAAISLGASYPQPTRPRGGGSDTGQEKDQKYKYVQICPIGLNGTYNGIYYYYARTCDYSQTPSSMTSTTPLQNPLGCVPENEYCHYHRIDKEAESEFDPAPHGVFSEVATEGLKSGKLPLNAAPYTPIRGEGLVAEDKNYQIIADNHIYYVRTFVVLCTPSGGTPADPRPPVLMGIGQELAGMPGQFEGGTDIFEIVDREGFYLHLKRKSDHMHFHVVIGP